MTKVVLYAEWLKLGEVQKGFWPVEKWDGFSVEVMAAILVSGN